MALRFSLDPSQIQAFKADQWLQDQRENLADEWLNRTMDQIRSPFQEAFQQVSDVVGGQPAAPDTTSAPAYGGSRPPDDRMEGGDLSATGAVQQTAPGSSVTPPAMDNAASPTAAPSPADSSFAPSTAGISGGGDLSGQVGDRGQSILSGAADVASWLGDQGQKALQAVLVTEGGLNNARGDQGKSAGPLQFYEGGQLANFAQQHGLSLEQAKQAVEADPVGAIQWAVGTPDKPGYLGAAIANGLKNGLSGADLATFAQRTGQVSVSPERAGQNFQSLFGQGADAIKSAASTVANIVPGGKQIAQGAADVSQAMGLSQFGDKTISADEAYAACGPAAAARLAQIYGNNIPLSVAVQAAKQVGWTPGAGMAGISSEKKLMDALGVPAELDTSGDWNKITSAAGSGQVVTISTPGHYFTASAARQRPDGQTELYVGASGTDLKAGKAWMTPGEMENVMGRLQGALFSDPSRQVQAGDFLQQSAQDHGVPVPDTPQNAFDDLAKAQQQAGVSRPAQRSPDETISNPFGDAMRQTFGSMIPGGGDSGVSRFSGGGGGGAGSADGGLETDAQAPATVPFGGSRPPEDRMPEPSVEGPPAPIPGAQPASQNPVQAFGQQIASGIMGLVQHLTGQQPSSGTIPAGPEGLPVQASGDPLAGAPSSPDQLPFGGRTAADLITEPLRGANAQAPLTAQEIGSALPSSPEQLPFGGRTAGDVVTNFLGAGPEAQQQYGQTLEGIQGAVGNILQGQEPTPEQKQAQTQGALVFGGTQALGGGESGAGEGGRPLFGRGGVPGGPKGGLESPPPATPPEGLVDALAETLRQLGVPEDTIASMRTDTGQPLARGAGASVPPERPPTTSAEVPGGAAPRPKPPAMDQGTPILASQPALPEFGEVLQSGQAVNRTAAIKAAAKTMGGDANKVIDWVQQFDAIPESDQAARYKLLQGLNQPSWWDRISILRYASMLSSTTTHLVNAFGNVINTGLDVALKPVAVGVDVARAAATGGERTRYMGELAPQVKGLLDGAADGFMNGLQILKTGVRPEDLGKFENLRGGFQSGSGAVDAAVEAPLRALGFADAVFRGAARGSEARALAARQGIKEGLSGQALRDRIDYIAQNLPEFPDIATEADKRAARVVLQEPNRIASSFSQVGQGPGARNAALRIVREIVIPFAKTPLNIMGQGLEMTPAGALKVRDLASAGETGAATDAAARVLFGSGVMVGIGALAANGAVTGGYPADPKERDTLPAGWQPWSLRLPNGQGGHTYFSFSQLGPISIPMAIGAVAGQSMREGVVADPVTLASSIGRFMLDQTFLQGLSAITDAIKDPKRYGENVAEQMATSFVPYAAMSREVTRILGQADRDPKGAIQAIQALIPGEAESVPRRQDALGRDIRSTQTGAGAALSPVRYSSTQSEPVLQAFRDVGMGLPSAPKEITVTSTVTGNTSLPIALNDVEQKQYQQLFGQRLQERLSPIVSSPEWANRSSVAKQKLLDAQVRAARNYAESRVYSSMAPADRQQRMQQGRAKQQQSRQPLPAP